MLGTQWKSFFIWCLCISLIFTIFMSNQALVTHLLVCFFWLSESKNLNMSSEEHCICAFHLQLCWIFPLCFGAGPAPPWTVPPWSSPGKGRISQECHQAAAEGGLHTTGSAGMGAWLGAGGGPDFEGGQQAKAVQDLVWWSSVLLPRWTLCPPAKDKRCWVTCLFNSFSFWPCLVVHLLCLRAEAFFRVKLLHCS